MLNRDIVIRVLREIPHPNQPGDIVSTGLIQEVAIDCGKVFVHLGMAPSVLCFQEKLKESIRIKLKTIPDVEDVVIQISHLAVRPATDRKEKTSIPSVRSVIAIASGKGGVGKTTVAVNLALALVKRGLKIGLLDGDIYGPNVPIMLGARSDQRIVMSENATLDPLEICGLKMISIGLLAASDEPIIWRGPLLHSAVRQFLEQVRWGELDVLVVDLPPGTGDVQLSLAQTVCLNGAVIVTTSQEVALADVRRAIAMFHKIDVPVLGIIENMSGDIFGQGGGEKLALESGIPFLAQIPLNREIRQGGDTGNPVIVTYPECVTAQNFMKTADALINRLDRTTVKSK
ncbi:MAG: Mrp/NBP35 family ATP-binding protein [Candidatus Omnitrophica bacterium]|nr:Mrp/NBP35 family ATP-binding protein [Candidatus Omnitrophota bacterium]MDD5671461.1 Mrp/NBP35 family ATP-binding protein [Candidatus Omnitrophota bacterium]